MLVLLPQDCELHDFLCCGLTYVRALSKQKAECVVLVLQPHMLRRQTGQVFVYAYGFDEKFAEAESHKGNSVNKKTVKTSTQSN